MTKHPRTRPFGRFQGVTLVEILMVISLLIILVAVAVPSVGSATARSELAAASENLQYSIETARNVARMSESAVSLDIGTSVDGLTQTIRFSHPDQRGRNIAPAIQEYRLPESVQLVADSENFVFDSRGLVARPGTIQLVSRSDESVTRTLNVD